MSQEAPMQPASEYMAAQANYGNPNEYTIHHFYLLLKKNASAQKVTSKTTFTTTSRAKIYQLKNKKVLKNSKVLKQGKKVCKTTTVQC